MMPSKEKMLLYIWKYLEKFNPCALEPKIARLARERCHLVLYRCQNYFYCQPFKLFNAHVKLLIKKRNRLRRTIFDLHVDILDGMYGGKNNIERDHKIVGKKLI